LIEQGSKSTGRQRKSPKPAKSATPRGRAKSR
jgi:hypothetical protein